MARYTAILLVALLAVGVRSQSCNTEGNQFLIWLESMSTGLMKSSPETGSNFAFCNEVWSTQGTCCDADKFKTVYQTKMAGIAKAWKSFMERMTKVKGLMEKVKKMTSNMDDAKAKMAAARDRDASNTDNLSVDNALKLMSYTMDDFENDLKDFKSNGKDCFNHLMSVRGKVFCYGCSANQADTNSFATQTGQLTITQTSCTAMLDKCLKTWRFFFRVGGMLQMAATLNKERHSGAQNPKKPEGGSSGFGSVSGSSIYEAFQNCSSTTTSETCTQEMLNNLCTAHFNIMKPEKRASDQNMDSQAVTSARLLQSSYTGESMVSSTSGADLTATVTTADSGQTVETASVSSSPTVTEGLAGLSKIFIGLLAIMVALLH